MVVSYDTRTQVPQCVADAARGAARLAEHHNHVQVLPIHLAVSLYNHPYSQTHDPTRKINKKSFGQWIQLTNGNSKLLARVLNNQLLRLPTQPILGSRLVVSVELAQILEEASINQNLLGSYAVTVDHLAKALMQDRLIKETLKHVSPLMRYTSDMTHNAKDRPNQIVGRQHEITTLRQILVKNTRNNPLLVGKSCVGKSSIIGGLAQYMACDGSTGSLKDYRMLFLDFQKLGADATDDAHLKELIKSVFEEVNEWNNKVILVVDDADIPVELFLSGSIGKLMRHMLSNSQPRCIFVLAPDQHEQYILRQDNFDHFFHKVQVEDLSDDEIISVLRIVKNQFETTDISISDDGIVTALKSARQNHKTKTVLDHAIFLIDQAVADMKILLAGQSTLDRHVTVQAKHILAIAAEAKKTDDPLGPIF